MNANRETINKTGYFLFSLDTELAWGKFDKFSPGLFSEDGKRERQKIIRILDILDEFNIIATWAVLGHLFYAKCEECEPCPILDWKGKYPVFESIYGTNHPLWYGVDIIEEILARKTSHEIALHGYTHRIFNHLTLEQATIEIQESLRMFMRKNVIPRTIIFPRNNIAHLDLFHQFGFTCYRGEELVPKYYRMPLLGRVFRRSHYYLSAVTVPIVYDYKYDPSGLVNLPSSRWFFGFNQRVERYLDALNLHLLRIHKMVKGVEKAAAEKKVIHIWTHPCEFKTEKDFDKLRYLFEAVSKQITRGSIQSVGMADLARKVFASGISNRQ